jgi:hypothetical protein
MEELRLVGGSFSSAGHLSGDDTAKRRSRMGFVLSLPLPATSYIKQSFSTFHKSDFFFPIKVKFAFLSHFH